LNFPFCFNLAPDNIIQHVLIELRQMAALPLLGEPQAESA